MRSLSALSHLSFHLAQQSPGLTPPTGREPSLCQGLYQPPAGSHHTRPLSPHLIRRWAGRGTGGSREGGQESLWWTWELCPAELPPRQISCCLDQRWRNKRSKQSQAGSPSVSLFIPA